MLQRILYAGDSTVTFNRISTYPQAGLSQGLLLYLKPDVFLRSFAVNGRSTKSFLEEGRFEEIKSWLSAGDFLFLQFGHNDEKKEDPTRYADPYGAYQENLKVMIDEARERGAHPVLITPMARRLFDPAGRFLGGSHGEYPESMLRLAERETVPCINLTQKSEEYLRIVGDVASRPLFVYPKDNSHLSHCGAAVMAGFLADGLMALGEPYSGLLNEEDMRGRGECVPAQIRHADAANNSFQDGKNVTDAVNKAFQDEKNE